MITCRPSRNYSENGALGDRLSLRGWSKEPRNSSSLANSRFSVDDLEKTRSREFSKELRSFRRVRACDIFKRRKIMKGSLETLLRPKSARAVPVTLRVPRTLHQRIEQVR